MSARPASGDRPVDDGSAMIMVLMVLALLAALGATMGAVTLSNLQASRRADEAARVVNAAEAGVSQAMTYMRSNGVGALTCRNSTPTAPAPTWVDCGEAYGKGAPVGPSSGSGSGARYSVWVEQVTKFVPNSGVQGVYVVHSVGTTSGTGVASCQPVPGPCRSVTAEVLVNGFALGTGIYIGVMTGNSNANATVTNESVFTTGCFPKRDGSFEVVGFDAAHGIPAGVHTPGIITTGPENKCNAANSIHRGSTRECNPSFPYDQDGQGSTPLKDTACWTKLLDPTFGGLVNEDVYGSQAGSADGVYGSKITNEAAMQEAFGIGPPSAEQERRLRAIAVADLTATTSNAWPTATATHGVYFFDLTGKSGSAADVDLGDIPSPFDTEDAACGGPVVIIKNGTAHTQNPADVVGASIYMIGPAGGAVTLKNGTVYGGLVAKTLDFVGHPYLTAPDCPSGSMNPALMTFTVRSYSEDD